MDCRQEEWLGFLFAMSNEIHNRISVFGRNYCGAITFLESYGTGGRGTGAEVVDPLSSQGSVILSHDGHFLFVVNAGDNTLSSFRLEEDCLVLVDVRSSVGVRPNSLAFYRDTLYVSNMGDSTNAASITGFIVGADGRLWPLANSTRLLSAANAEPACILFDPDGEILVVSERGTNRLSVFELQADGALTGPVVNASNGTSPFGAVFPREDILLVSEAGPNALSSYDAEMDGTLSVISGSIPNNQLGTCWVSMHPNKHYAYTSNAGSGTVTLYYMDDVGELTTIESVPTTPQSTGGPIDNAISPCGEYLYVLNGAEGTISVFRITVNGHPTLIQIYQNTELPPIGAQGLAIL